MAYRVPFVNFPEHYHRLKPEFDAAVNEIFEGGDLIMRRQLAEFENNLAAFVGTRYAIGVASGTDALVLSLRAAGVGPGDEVITVAHTFVATLAAIVHNGATPVLIDVAEDYNMDASLLEAALTPRTKAIIPVHLNGRLCDMEQVMSFAEAHHLAVIEDAAQALGASLKGRRGGNFGLTGCFSFYPAKILGGFGDGGGIVTNDTEINEKVRLLRDHGQQRTTGEILFYGYNSRLDNLQAALLDVKLRHLPDWIMRRRELAARYEQGLSVIKGVTTPPPPDARGDYFDIYTNYVIRAERRDQLVTYLREQGIEVLVSWPKPLHRQAALGLGQLDLPETDRVSREVVSLPLIPELSDAQIDIVIETVAGFYQ